MCQCCQPEHSSSLTFVECILEHKHNLSITLPIDVFSTGASAAYRTAAMIENGECCRWVLLMRMLMCEGSG